MVKQAMVWERGSAAAWQMDDIIGDAVEGRLNK